MPDWSSSMAFQARPSSSAMLFVCTSLLLFIGGCQCGGGGDGDGGTDGGRDGSTPLDLCGSGKLDPGEQCDDGNSRSLDGCSSACRIEPGWACPTPNVACTFSPTCGDTFLEASEECDDGNASSGDGCSSTCKLESGWVCPVEGSTCIAAKCGDGKVAGSELCDDGNAVDGDGCDHSCQFEKGFKCDNPGQPCTPAVCGNNVREGAEQCDDGNNDLGDGCAPDCTSEPKCLNGVCESVCGDGVLLPAEVANPEACDDGNTRSGDGCSSTCKREKDFKCDYVVQPPANTFVVPLVLRDFLGQADIVSAGDLNFHTDFDNVTGDDRGITGPLYSALGADGKPPYAFGAANSTNGTVHGATGFAQWYRDTAKSKTVVTTMTLDRQAVDGSYVFSNPFFFPLDGLGWIAAGNEKARNANDGKPHNFSFTSEVRYWFEFKGTEKLTFKGDDDVWVYINKKLALDIGGVHGVETQSIDLSDPSKVSALGLTTGGIYEVVVFQAERHVTASNYFLTLNGFEKRSSICKSKCGDGVVDSIEGEECDDGNTVSGDGCSATCHGELN